MEHLSGHISTSRQRPTIEFVAAYLVQGPAAAGLPEPSSMPTFAEAQEEAQQRSEELFSRWHELQHILARHEGLIRKRWLKKTKRQRTATILKAWPHMSTSHRPDWEAFLKEVDVLKTRTTRYRDAYVWPYINVEDLVKDNALLLFLNSRGKHAPAMFAFADADAMRLGRIKGAVRLAFLQGHTMPLVGDTPGSYARVLPWDETSMMKTIARIEHETGEGLLILEIQQKILNFLVKCCQGILHDMSTEEMITKAPTLPDPPLITDTSDWPSVAAMTAEAPYRLPPKPDFASLKAMVDAKRASIEDTIWALREDPCHFAEVVGDWGIHRQEQMLDTKGKTHPDLNKPVFWDAVLGTLVSHFYGMIVIWDILSKQLGELVTIQAKYSSQIKPHERLPTELAKVIASFRFMLEQVSDLPVSRLQIGIPSSPNFRHLWTRDPPTVDGSPEMIRSKQMKTQDRLIFLIDSVFNKRDVYGLPALMDEIEHVPHNSTPEKARISPWVADVFSDLGFLGRLENELAIYQPWAATLEYEYQLYKVEIHDDYQRRTAHYHVFATNLRAVCTALSLSDLGAPKKGRFTYPSDKRRTETNTRLMRQAEYNLDLFWESLDAQHKKSTGRILTEAVSKFVSTFDVPTLERTPEWIEPVKEPISMSQKIKTKDLYDPFNSLSLASAEPEPKFVAPEQRIKPKTHGTIQNTPAFQVEDLQIQTETDLLPTFTLKARSHKVFETLFHNPATSDLPGEILWADFLFAMSETDFAPEKLYGSVWQFSPLSLDVERSIHFHEPHPVGKIPFWKVRRMGRRLNRAYGWHGGMFVLE